MLAASVTAIVQVLVTAQLFGICPRKKENVCVKLGITQYSFFKSLPNAWGL